MQIAPAVLRAFIADIFAAAGCSSAEAGRIARYLVAANLCGHDSHGVIRAPRYVQALKNNEVFADQTVAVASETGSLAVLDGRFGFGQTVAPQAVAIGIAKARALGAAVVALRNAGHIGRAGDWAEMAAEAGLISIHFVNVQGSLLVAPFGGVDRRISTAPFCVGVPRPDGAPPLLLDFATSHVAEGKVLVASAGGKPVPGDALINPDGSLTGDPHALYGEYEPAGPRNSGNGLGAIRAFGGHKGSGLAFMCEILAGALTGGGTCGPLEPGLRRGRRISNGMLSVYLAPGFFGDPAAFEDAATRYVEFFASSRPDSPGGEVLVPGEPEARMRAEREAGGIPLPADAWQAIIAAARSVDVAETHIPQGR
ncbi:MAG: malate/lactate/ureidoglycolate dehydrogenase [Alphaproteobacteria bacterium]|nr:malate/lactate/ureidoglycolate dehydrogenase [Alphaproteobacteria bacterium]